ncbi:hypothetical protein ACFLSF_04470 [Candidatus Bipolaricaulota bacterium]
MSSRSLLDLSYEDLIAHLTALGQPSYRGQQIWQAVYKDLASSYDRMTTLPAALRTELSQSMSLMPLEVAGVLHGPSRRFNQRGWKDAEDARPPDRQRDDRDGDDVL